MVQISTDQLINSCSTVLCTTSGFTLNVVQSSSENDNTPQKLSSARIVEEVRKQYAEKMIKVPSEATIRRRLRALANTQLKIRGDQDYIHVRLARFKVVP